MSVPNQVWTFRLSKFEGVDRVDQVALQLPRVSGDGIGCVGVGCDDVVKEYKCKSFIPIV